MTKYINQRFSLLFLSALLLSFASEPALAADEAATAKTAKDASTSSAEDAEAKERIKHITFDLGSFRLREFRPTRNDTAALLFAVHLKLHDDTSEKTLERLQNWKQRLRNETLTAIRSVDLADYQEPGLERVQKVILLRINRLLPLPLVKRIYVTEFTIGDH